MSFFIKQDIHVDIFYSRPLNLVELPPLKTGSTKPVVRCSRNKL